MTRYTDLNTYLRGKYGVKVYKACIDGGFTCPNRDGTRAVGGCSFCGDRGAGENINKLLPIDEQVSIACQRSKLKHKAKKFVVYFQGFSGTFDSVENLRRKYEKALADEEIVALSIATRPDCIDKNVIALLCELRTKHKIDIWVEFGLQTTNDKIADSFNRCYPTKLFYDMVNQLRLSDIDVITHVLFGLPGETRDSMLKTVKDIAKLDIQGVKFHCLYIMKGTALEETYLNNKYRPLSEEAYIEILVKAITLLPRNIVIHRLVSDCRRDMLVAPLWLINKSELRDKINAALEKFNLHQGDLYVE